MFTHQDDLTQSAHSGMHQRGSSRTMLSEQPEEAQECGSIDRNFICILLNDECWLIWFSDFSWYTVLCWGEVRLKESLWNGEKWNLWERRMQWEVGFCGTTGIRFTDEPYKHRSIRIGGRGDWAVPLRMNRLHGRKRPCFFLWLPVVLSTGQLLAKASLFLTEQTGTSECGPVSHMSWPRTHLVIFSHLLFSWLKSLHLSGCVGHLPVKQAGGKREFLPVGQKPRAQAVTSLLSLRWQSQMVSSRKLLLRCSS